MDLWGSIRFDLVSKVYFSNLILNKFYTLLIFLPRDILGNVLVFEICYLKTKIL